MMRAICPLVIAIGGLNFSLGYEAVISPELRELGARIEAVKTRIIQGADAIALPRNAVVKEGSQYFVMAGKTNQLEDFERREVKIGDQWNPQYIEADSGISPGQYILVKNVVEKRQTPLTTTQYSAPRSTYQTAPRKVEVEKKKVIVKSPPVKKKAAPIVQTQKRYTAPTPPPTRAVPAPVIVKAKPVVIAESPKPQASAKPIVIAESPRRVPIQEQRYVERDYGHVEQIYPRVETQPAYPAVVPYIPQHYIPEHYFPIQMGPQGHCADQPTIIYSYDAPPRHHYHGGGKGRGRGRHHRY